MSEYDFLYFKGKSLMEWAIEWFSMPNDCFYRIYGFNLNPHNYPGLYEQARQRVYGR